MEERLKGTNSITGKPCENPIAVSISTRNYKSYTKRDKGGVQFVGSREREGRFIEKDSIKKMR